MGASRHPVEITARLGGVGRLAQHLAVEDDIGVAGDHQRAGRALDRARLATRVLDHQEFGVPAVELLDPGDDDLELDPQLGEDLAPLRRARGEDYGGQSLQLGEPDADLALGRLVGVGAVDHVEGHLEGEVATDRAGSGLDRVGRADQLARRLDGFDPSKTIATSGPPVMKVTSSPKKGFSLCSA